MAEKRTSLGLIRLGVGVERTEVRAGRLEAGDSMRILLDDGDPAAQKRRVRLPKDDRTSGRRSKQWTLEAIRVLQSRSYDVIFMDLQMPEMNVLETAKTIRYRWPYRRIKIIAVTSCSDEGCWEMGIQMGIDGYIAEPAKKENILAFLE